MKFIADDGKIFDTMEECEEYETKISAIPLAYYWYNNITMVDKTGRPLRLNIDPTHPDYIKRLVSFLERDEIYYLIIPKKCDNDVQWKKLCVFFEDECVVVPTSSGIWYWSNDEWHNFTDDYKDFMYKWKPIERYLPNMDVH